MNRGLISAAILAVLAAPAAAGAGDGVDSSRFHCRKPWGFEAVTAHSALPSALLKEFAHIAMPGEDWNDGDTGEPGESTVGLDLLWHRRERWIAFIGHGGFGTYFEVVAFDLSRDGRQATQLPVPFVNFDERELCRLANFYTRA
jgi:hypothetical protein